MSAVFSCRRSAVATDRDVIVYRISGAFFFGAAAAVGVALDRLNEHPKAYVLDVSAVPVLDSTALATIQGFANKARRRGVAVYIAGARPGIRRTLLAQGVRPPLARFRSVLAEAIEAARRVATQGSFTLERSGAAATRRRRCTRLSLKRLPFRTWSPIVTGLNRRGCESKEHEPVRCPGNYPARGGVALRHQAFSDDCVDFS